MVMFTVLEVSSGAALISCKYSLPGEQHVAGEKAPFVPGRLCEAVQPISARVLELSQALCGEAAAQQSLSGLPVFRLLEMWCYC